MAHFGTEVGASKLPITFWGLGSKKQGNAIVGKYQPGNGEEGSIIAGEKVSGVEDDLRELEQ